VVSAGLDNHVIVWDIETLSKEQMFQHVHRSGSNGAAFIKEKVIVTCGGDSLIKEIDL